MAVCGVLLIVMMGALLVGFTFILLHNEPDAKVRFSGGPLIAAFVYALFGAILAFGCGALTSGVRQIRSGRRDLLAVGWARYILIVMSGAGVLVQIIELLTD